MANIRVSASKKTTVIILLLLFLVVGGTGGYLLWRVNQEKTVAPTDSEAGGDICCCPGGNIQNCDDYPWSEYDECICTNGWCPTVPHCSQQCVKGSDCNSQTNCEWPAVAYCAMGKCECKSSNNGCNPDYSPCNPTCPSGYSPCTGTGCTGDVKNASCTANCDGCGNKYTRTIKCNKVITPTCGDGTVNQPSEECDPLDSPCTTATGKSSTCSSTCTCPEPIVINKCDALNAKWVTKPATTIPYGQLIPFEYVTGDTDGVQNETIIVKIDGNSTSVTKIPATGNPTNITVKGSLNGSEGVLSPGTHKLEISWNDTKGAGGVPCYAYASFTVGAAPVNTCDAQGAKWVTQPPSRVEFGKPIPFEYITGDTDGVQNVNIIVKLDGTSVPVTKIPATDNAPNITVKGTLNGSEGVLSPGNHKLEISWNDIKGAGGVPCYAYSMITVLPENPEWDIEKKAVQTCVNDWTENPTSNLTYTVTITNTNTGSGAGTITRILDTLDPKVDSTKVTNISNGGVIQNGIITWNLTSPLSDFDPGESKSFTYSISVNKESFGIYENTVVAIPDTSSGDSSNLEASVNIEARCNVPGEPVQPDTGLFDDSKNIVILGAALLFAGLGWSWITDSFGTMKQKISYESKARFEKRVSKR